MKSLLLIAFLSFFALDCSAQLILDKQKAQLEKIDRLDLSFLNNTIFSNSIFSTSLNLPSTSPQAFFCRLEHKNDKRNKIQTRFRLGSVDQANYLEGKHQ